MLLTISLAVAMQTWAADAATSSPRFVCADGDQVALRGYVGHRVERNTRGILLHKDEKALLEPFRDRTTRDQAWAGEHVGKWLSAASMAYAYSKDDELRAKLKRVADGLVATQLDNGYLGTYTPENYWTGWDVWVHKYNLLGLEAYYLATGNATVLPACRKVGDLLADTFGPQGKDILQAGEHGGMAPASVLEPIAELYRLTGEKRYRAFAEYIAASLARPGGPRIIDSLLEHKTVLKVGNAKAYEMISCLMGLLAMHRQNPDPRILKAARIAADDIIDHLAYVTGGVTYAEFFCEPGVLPNSGSVAETCVTMSQVQLYRELLELTGDPKYGGALEHLLYNHLLACQHPEGKSVCYYTPLWGHKFYFDFLGCCISSGPRVIAMIPSLYYLLRGDRVVVNLLGASELNAKLADLRPVRIVQTTDYPFSDQVNLRITSPEPGGFTLLVRIPQTAGEVTVNVDGKGMDREPAEGELVELAMPPGEHTVDLKLNPRWQIHKGTGANEGLFALQRGPIVYAYDYALNREAGRPDDTAFEMDLAGLSPRVPEKDGRRLVEVNGHVRQADGRWAARTIRLLPFADAGVNDYFSVWLRDRARHDRGPFSLFTQVSESSSRIGRHSGSIADNSADTFTSTDDGKRSDSDWFEVNAGWHANYNLIVFRHGRSSPNGGWFDTSKGKPRVLFKSWGDYHEVAVLDEYPDTTATSPGRLVDGQAIRVVIPRDKRKPEFRVRIAGTPAHGNDPTQNFATCGEIQVLYDPDL